MTADSRVTDFVAHYSLDHHENWAQVRENWRQVALDSWLAAAEQQGLNVIVQRVSDESNTDVAVVEVDGQEYVITHLTRRPEVQAVAR